MNRITIRMPSGTLRTFTGRDAWTLCRLIEAGVRGVTTLGHPAPRWSQYIFRLRKAGLVISTEYERHSGPFPGSHGRYRLETPVTVVAEAA
ncbi:hypothetical protein ACH79_07435 [Bradyrhizobium sp. CCBAU 051011]|uniref:winged helix domain-containing protein n=1 Tax=Bradyrhizobium sp. CCBAU 051011 TaxID=858422 RepID=UPI0013742F52|nr:hypothetical protein [Bradyrhizobium sp. CCBAU 051011]QHO72480.1 hypothetical protein ACH79_07435 [Bradyrhizobium sp. CCBAU 051011]